MGLRFIRRFHELTRHFVVIAMLSSSITGFSTPVCLAACECCVDASSDDTATTSCLSSRCCCSGEESRCFRKSSCCDVEGREDLKQCNSCSCCLCGCIFVPALEPPQFTLQSVAIRCCSLHELYLVKPDRKIGRNSTSPFLLPIRLNVLFSVWLN